MGRSRYFFVFISIISLSLSSCQFHQTVLEKEHPSTAIENFPNNFTVTILGSGTPLPSRTQAGAAILVEAGETILLFDCGRGCTKRIEEYNPALIAKIDKLFLTHLHSDHTVGIPDLWLNGWTLRRQKPLQIWGPDGVENMMKGLRTAYTADIGYRTKPNQLTPIGLQLRLNKLDKSGKIIFESDGLKVIAFEVNHAHVPAYGYRIEYGQRSLLISGDTTKTSNLITYGENVNVALLEVLSPAMIDSINAKFKPKTIELILNLHLTTEQASQVFEQIKPQLGIYYHTVAECKTDKRLLAETRKNYSGAIKVARDLMQINIYPDHVKTNYLAIDGDDCR